MGRIETLNIATLCICLIIFQFPCTISTSTGFSLELIPRDSPGSPLYPGNLTVLERLKRLIKFSQDRGSYLANFKGRNASENLVLPVLRGHFYYMVEVRIGSRDTLLYLVPDTGSGLVWTQCQPCISCYPQRFPIYDSLTSVTYRKLTCDHSLCSGDNPMFRCVDDECLYANTYGGGGITRGAASLETFKFSVSTRTSTTIIDGIVFGCSDDNRNLQIAEGGLLAGIMGLSMARDSLISQLSIPLNHRFSYCLVPFIEARQEHSILSFGDDTPHPSGPVHFTKFVTPPGSEYYYLSLIDISIATTRIGFPPGTFAVREGLTGGLIIDNGATMSLIEQSTPGVNAFRVVLREFQRYYDARRLVRAPAARSFQLCYKNAPGFSDYASMTYHFEDADYVVEGRYVNFFADAYFCVALLPLDGMSILGAWHQANMRLIYDGNLGGLQFTPENCP